MFNKINDLLKDQEIEQANILLGKIYEKDRNAEYYYLKGKIFFHQKSPIEAMELINKAINLDKSKDKYFIEKAYIHFSLFQFEDAIKNYDEAIRINKGNAFSFFWRGFSYHNLLKYEEAHINFQEAIKLHPKRSNFFYRNGRSLLCLKRYNEAIKNFDDAIKLNERDVLSFYFKGLAYFNCKNYSDALRNFDAAIDFSFKKSDDFLFQKGKTLYHLKRFQESIDILERAIKINPKASLYYNYKGLCYFSLEYLEEAIKNIDKAISLDSRNAEFFNCKGMCLDKMKNYKDAVENYNKSIRLNIKESQYYLNKANSLKLLGNFDDAFKEYCNSLNLYNIDPIVIKNIIDISDNFIRENKEIKMQIKTFREDDKSKIDLEKYFKKLNEKCENYDNQISIKPLNMPNLERIKNLNEEIRVKPENIVDNEPNDDFYICQICLNIVINYKTCGNCDMLFCEDCINYKLKKTDGKCPYCNIIFKPLKNNVILKKQIDNLIIKCPLECNKIFCYNEINLHIMECENNIIKYQCDLCTEIIKGKNKENPPISWHTKSCKKMNYMCKKCNSQFGNDNIQNHSLTCNERIVSCQFCKVNYPLKYKDSHKNHYCDILSQINEFFFKDS